ncbi:hypothetical protein IWX46DRAFT_584379 [Phyllosticta citricarpa]|uniref:Uncharacterized protein n=1 Tax=Phyllosticta citricarpa TaxID=55181 RepID=A0ABR1LGS1_9PEZI
MALCMQSVTGATSIIPLVQCFSLRTNEKFPQYLRRRRRRRRHRQAKALIPFTYQAVKQAVLILKKGAAWQNDSLNMCVYVEQEGEGEGHWMPAIILQSKPHGTPKVGQGVGLVGVFRELFQPQRADLPTCLPSRPTISFVLCDACRSLEKRAEIAAVPASEGAAAAALGSGNSQPEGHTRPLGTPFGDGNDDGVNLFGVGMVRDEMGRARRLGNNLGRVPKQSKAKRVSLFPFLSTINLLLLSNYNRRRLDTRTSSSSSSSSSSSCPA